jgi:hypothetical protein
MSTQNTQSTQSTPNNDKARAERPAAAGLPPFGSVPAWMTDPKEAAELVRGSALAAIDGAATFQAEAKKAMGAGLAQAKKEGEALMAYGQRVAEDALAASHEIAQKSLAAAREQVERLGKAPRA